jgi:hypothetical protein
MFDHLTDGELSKARAAANYLYENRENFRLDPVLAAKLSALWSDLTIQHQERETEVRGPRRGEQRGPRRGEQRDPRRGEQEERQPVPQGPSRPSGLLRDRARADRLMLIRHLRQIRDHMLYQWRKR